MFKSQAIMTYAQIFNPGDKYLQPILRANRVIRRINFSTQNSLNDDDIYTLL